MKKKYHILFMNGPNLNLLGIRELKKYGYITLDKIINDLKIQALDLNINLSFFQSNAEHDLINCIHQSINKIDFIIINPAAFTHTSIALRDAFLSVQIPFIELHISNIYSREFFRHYSYLSDLAVGVISGFGSDGYHVALQIAYKRLFKNK